MKPIQTTEPIVRDFMTRGVLSLYSDSNASRAIKSMINHNVGSIVVAGNEGPAGIFTERDLLGRVLAEHLSPETTPVASVMSPVTARVDPTQSPQQAARYRLSRNKIQQRLAS